MLARFTQSRYANVILYGLWCVLILVTSFYHEHWRDEGEFWLLATRGSWHDIIESATYTGHPLLWTVMLGVLGKLGLPIISQTILHLLLAMLAGALLVFRCPLSFWLRAGILFSVHMSFEYAVVVRQYVLIELFMFAICAMYAQRLAHPLRYALLLALLFQTAVHAWPMAAILSLFFFLDTHKLKEHKRRYLMAYILIACSFVGALYMLIPALQHALPFRDVNMFIGRCLLAGYISLGEGFFPAYQFFHLLGGPIYMTDKPTQEFFPFTHSLFPGLALLIILASIEQLGARTRAAVFLVGSIGTLLLFFIFIYPPSFRHIVIIPLTLLCAYWIWGAHHEKGRKWLRGLVTVAVVYSAGIGVLQHVFDWEHPFSGGKDMAEYLHSNHAGERIAVDGCAEINALNAYLSGQEEWLVSYDTTRTFLRWDQQMYDCINRTFRNGGLQRFRAAVHSGKVDKNMVFVSYKNLQPFFSDVVLLHASPGLRESFYVYRLKPVQTAKD